MKRRGTYTNGRGTALSRLFDMRSTVVVTGKPGSGKSTYVRANMLPDEPYWDFDEVMAQLSGKPVHVKDAAFLPHVYARRDHFVNQADGAPSRVWFIAEDENSFLVQLMVRAGAKVVRLEIDERERLDRLAKRDGDHPGW